MSKRYQGGILGAGFDPLKAPNAPTGVTATAGNASASVSFTAPTNVGGSAITGYTGRSNPGGISATGSASPLVFSGLSNGTPYTFDVWANNSYGPSPVGGPSNSVTPVAPPNIGDAYGGGYYAGQIVQGGVTYYLIVAPKATGQSTSALQWRTSNTASPPTATQTINNGFAASAAMNSTTYPAARFCETLSIGGFTDWYLPSRDELEICYRNLKPTTASNATFLRPVFPYGENPDVGSPQDTVGINRNSSPIGAAYTSSVPAQTSAAAFKSGGAEAFNEGSYWSSSYAGSTNAWYQSFTNGGQDYNGMTGVVAVRAVRRVAA